MLFFVPSVLAVCLFMALPWSNSAGLLSAYYLLNFGGAPSWAIVVGWVAVTTSGHTKVHTRGHMPRVITKYQRDSIIH